MSKNFSLNLDDQQKKRLKKAVEEEGFCSKAEYVRHLIRQDDSTEGDRE